jgi:PAS domain S-box-containing protein
MKIRQKLILGFAGIASLVGVVGIMCVNTSQRALQKSTGESSVALAVETMDKIDRNIYYTIEEFQAYCSDLVLQKTIEKSNREFEKLENLQEYIDEKNNEWISAQKATITPLMQELLNNKLSEELRKKIGFHEEKHGYKVFGEVFVTNKYGANAALTEKTSDYRQDDEIWWEKAKEDGLYVGDVEYDESSGIHSTAIAIRSNDKEGNFNGVVKVVLNIEEAIDIIRKTKEVTRYNNAQFKLLDRNGKAIFDQSGEFKFFEDISNREFFKKLAGDSGYLRKKAEGQQKGKTELLAFARSQGHNDHEGLGWILTIEYQTAKLFAPVFKLRNIILSISLVLTILTVIPGILISNYISKPLSKLKAAIDKIGKGDMGIKVDIKRNDEIGQLGHAFNQMVEHRKQTKEALRVSEHKYSDLVQQSPDAIISLDKIGNFLSFNPAAERLSGFSAQKVIGKHFAKVGILDKKSIPKSIKEFGLIITGTERQPFDLIITHKDKSHVHMEANGRLIKQKGQKTWVQVTLRDVTERLHAEQELEKVNKDLESAVWELRRANKELQEFAYITAHDLKTPLRGIGTLADWISTDYADKFDKEGKKQVRLLVGKAKQMSALIDDILQYSRLGHSSPEKRQVNLNTVLSDVIAGIEPPENIEITAENELPVLMCEKTQIIQVFQNLLSNAVKYMDKTEGQIKVGCVEQDGFLKFSIADNGPGIDEKYFKKIFKIFQALSTENRVDSTGIGLSIVKKIVELNAGIVWVESELGKGSTFFFTLPKSYICQEVLAGSTAEQA